MNRLTGFLSNDSLFGRIMTRIGIMIAANLMFIVFSIPVVTVGASLTGLYTVSLRMLRGAGNINPFREFWNGFRGNFKQATIAWLTVLFLAGVGYFDIRICSNAQGYIGSIRYVIYAFGFILAVGTMYLFPVMAAFDNTIFFLFRTGLYFALKNPLKMIAVILLHVIPLMITYLDLNLQPLFVFIWFFVGFAGIAMSVSNLILPEFIPFLPFVDSDGNIITDEDGNQLKPYTSDDTPSCSESVSEKTEEEILEEMKRLDS